jgi:hypothetical protein
MAAAGLIEQKQVADEFVFQASHAIRRLVELGLKAKK